MNVPEVARLLLLLNGGEMEIDKLVLNLSLIFNESPDKIRTKLRKTRTITIQDGKVKLTMYGYQMLYIDLKNYLADRKYTSKYCEKLYKQCLEYLKKMFKCKTYRGSLTAFYRAITLSRF